MSIVVIGYQTGLWHEKVQRKSGSLTLTGSMLKQQILAATIKLVPLQISSLKYLHMVVNEETFLQRCAEISMISETV